MRARQLSLIEVPVTLAELTRDPGSEYGEVFTRRWIVELILDLVGYSADEDLGARRLVEPSCGTGAFLVPVVERLIASSLQHGRELESLGGAVRAFDLLDANAERSRKACALRLEEAGLDETTATDIASTWVTTGDFLLADHEPGSADHVIGNPPYIRLENVQPRVMEAYRRRCSTMRGRSDIYVGFIEVGLELLSPEGRLGFICADRWMRNQYGADLRTLVAGSFAVDTVLTMHDVDAFEDDVSAYPAIIVLRHGDQRRAVVADATAAFGEEQAVTLSRWARQSRRRILSTPSVVASRLDGWFDGADLWPAGTPTQLALIAELEDRFPPLEDHRTGTRVGIGVATGCDDVYITADPDLVESDRLLPLLQAGDVTAGEVDWSGGYLVNPWDAEGLVDLGQYPRLGQYLRTNGARLRGRHTARKNPSQWYRTIDRVNPDLKGRPKLVLPDIKATSHPVIDEGRYYPHHNLYVVTSAAWDLEVLGGLLLSDIANLFVGAYCVKMRGGCYRFQAQYLRRIRVPAAETLSKAQATALADAFVNRDRERATAVAARCFGLDRHKLTAVGLANEQAPHH
ncbi:MAG: Eco57I restriction-modification methylase domain-containing protein [Actinomycetota bacterium]|nr:Eco57I restriction-modification methylase domain-containing protein [Actinomycetota bacterium]